MEIILNEQQIIDPRRSGNKAAMLARLMRDGFNVPGFFVIASECFDPGVPAKPVQQAIAKTLATTIGGNDRVAVRSSSVEEDGCQHSFAGQFDSFLEINPDSVFEHAVRVANSDSSERVRRYRETVGAAAESLDATRGPAVLVQEMVRADCAGVAFAADPVSGDASFAVVAATGGTGEALVSGETQGDTWRVDIDGSIIAREVEGDAAVLDDPDIVRVAALARAVSEHLGRPQDIEWAIADGELYLLQSRDITTIGEQAKECWALWDNSNIVESYGGVTLPLTFSVARAAYQEAYRHLGRALGIREKVIVSNRRAYEQMIGLIQGRVYYNLLNWYQLLMLTPGFRFNKGFMEQMMGVTRGLPRESMPRPVTNDRLAGIKGLLDMLRVAGRLTSKLVTHNRKVRQFHAKMDDLMAPIDLQAMSADVLIDYYEALQSEVIPAWDTPLVNDLYCMIFHGALRKLSDQWLDDELEGVHNDLVAGEAAIVSLEPVRRMKRMAALANVDPQFVSILQNASVKLIEEEIRRMPEFDQEYETYLDRFGDRCLDELKLESETLRDNPAPLLRSIGQLARMPDRESTGDGLRQVAEQKLEQKLRNSHVKRLLFNLVLRCARACIRDRENLRFERTRVYGRVRAIFVEIGHRLQNAGTIDRVDDIFYLDVAEITAFIRGTGVTGDLSTMVECRRREFAGYASNDDPPRRFMTHGPAQLRSSIRLLPEEAEDCGEIRTGQACSQGVVRGPVRIVSDPRNTDFQEGEILVAQRTDPGWVTIFPLVRGMVMERGSLLSHSAIVARELNIPAVVGVENACQWLSDGDWVELDGATGVIRRLELTEQAA